MARPFQHGQGEQSTAANQHTTQKTGLEELSSLMFESTTAEFKGMRHHRCKQKHAAVARQKLPPVIGALKTPLI